MLILLIKKAEMRKIKSGEKTVDYRKLNLYWSNCIFKELKRELKKHRPNLKDKIASLRLQDFLEMAKDDFIVFEPSDSFSLQGVFRLKCGKEELSVTITKIEIVFNRDTHINKSVYAIHFKLGE